MLIIGICDADACHREMIKSLIESVFFEKTEVTVRELDSEQATISLISSGAVAFDLLILDAGGCGGLGVADYIKHGEIHTDVIVYTQTPAYVFEGYKYGLFDYVLKQQGSNDLYLSLQRYIKEKLDCGAEYLSVRTNGCMQNIKLDKVNYFESRGRKIAAVAMDEKFEFYQKMDELMSVLPPGSFIRCHQSYTVNIRAIYSFSSTSVVLKNGLNIPVSRKYYQDIKSLFETMSNMT